MSTVRSQNTTKCRSCGTINSVDLFLCKKCGWTLRQGTGFLQVSSMAELDDKYGTKSLPNRLFLKVRDVEKLIIVEFGDGTQHIIGRYDPQTRTKPSIDLTYYQGGEKGVSRRHAMLSVEGKTLHLSDLGSVNGTYVNEQRVDPNGDVVVHEGDEMRFGDLAVLIVFHDET